MKSKTEEKACIFCEIANKQKKAYVIDETKQIIVILDLFPISDGHVLIITKKHYENITFIDEESWLDVLIATKKIISKLQEKFGYQNFNIINNVGKLAYQTIFHTHIHVIPKEKKDDGFILKSNVNLKYSLVDVFNKIME